MPPSNSSPKCPDGALRILVVDDEPDALSLYGILLGRIVPTPEVLAACNGEEALRIWAHEKAAGRKLDLVVSDLYFGSPTLTGLTLIDELHKGGYRGKTALLTGDEEAKELPASMFGIDWVWTKPYDAMRLNELVTQVLNLTTMQQKDTTAAPMTWKTKSPVVDYVTLGLLSVMVMLSMFNLVRSTYIAGMIQDTSAYVKNHSRGVSGGANGQVLEARIPTGKAFLPPALRDGQQDIVLRVSPEDAAKARQIAHKRGVRLRVEVR